MIVNPEHGWPLSDEGKYVKIPKQEEESKIQDPAVILAGQKWKNKRRRYKTLSVTPEG